MSARGTGVRAHLNSPTRLPAWVMLLVGVICVGLGGVLTVRPFTSLAVLILLVGAVMFATGAGTLFRARHGNPTGLQVVVGVAWIIGGIAVVAWPHLTVRGVAIVASIVLLIGGVEDVVGALRGSTDERLAAAVGGLARIVFGVLALVWPDVTVLVVAICFGLATIVFGARLVIGAFRRSEDDVASRQHGNVRRFAHVLGVSVVLVLALALAGFSAKAHEGERSADAFYRRPSTVPPQPGQLLRTETFTRAIPANARAWRILYTTTRNKGEPAIASALVVVPKHSTGALPVIAWAHGTTGVRSNCAPSLLRDPFGAGAFYALDRVVANNWALVATDYVGLGTAGPHPYLIGQGEARSVLDAVRAAKHMRDVDLADKTVVWGHSQGGGAALWTGAIASEYAPDAHVVGVAALAPASDLIGLVHNLPKVKGGSIFASYVLEPYSEIYSDVRLADYVRPTARLTVRKLADRCLSEPAILGSVASSLATGFSAFSRDAAEGPLGRRLRENTTFGPIRAPLLLAQGTADSLIVPGVQRAYVDRLCARGQAVDYRTYAGRDHVPLVQADSPLLPDLVAWTRDRFADKPAQSTC